MTSIFARSNIGALHQQVVIEGDSLEIIQALRKDGQCWSSYGHLINGAKTLLSEVSQWEAHHVRRSKNFAAHHMAKMALVIGEECSWDNNYPAFIDDLVSDM
jgi:hypothetical protein